MPPNAHTKPTPQAHARAAPLGVALIGYGSAGRWLHAPLIAAVAGLRLVRVVSSRVDQVQVDWPGVAVGDQADAAWADPAVDVAVIATPNASHAALAHAALTAGKHVVVDKPATTSLQEAEHLAQQSQALGRIFTVFQNRRWDADFHALQAVLRSGVLGRLVQVDSAFDRYRPVVPVRWREQALPGSGLWMDLGPHLLDQVICLWGAPDAIHLDRTVLRDGAVVDDWFQAVLRYDRAGAPQRVVLRASTLAAQPAPRWVVHGTRGSATWWGLDGQEAALKAGVRPVWDDRTGGVATADWGGPVPGEVLTWRAVPGVVEPVSVRQAPPPGVGAYPAFYANLRDHLRGRVGGADACALAVSIPQILAVMGALTQAV